MNEMMIDVESFGLERDSVLTSIGIVVFDTTYPELIRSRDEIVVNVASELLSGSVVDPKTVEWWKSQEAAISDKFAGNVETTSIVDALRTVTEDWVRYKCQTIWTSGEVYQLDVGNLEYKYRRLGLKEPWSFKQVRGLRTAKDMARRVGWKNSVPDSTEQHGALADAVYQARVVNDIMSYMKGLPPKSFAPGGLVTGDNPNLKDTVRAELVPPSTMSHNQNEKGEV